MNLASKRELAARTLGVGKGRILFITSRIAEIQEAITKQDIRDLVASGAIVVRQPQGRRKVERRTTRRRAGSIKKRVSTGKKEYVTSVRRFRAHIKDAKRKSSLKKEHYTVLRKEIRSRHIRTKAQLKDRIAALQKQ